MCYVNMGNMLWPTFSRTCSFHGSMLEFTTSLPCMTLGRQSEEGLSSWATQEFHIYLVLAHFPDSLPCQSKVASLPPATWLPFSQTCWFPQMPPQVPQQRSLTVWIFLQVLMCPPGNKFRLLWLRTFCEALTHLFSILYLYKV